MKKLLGFVLLTIVLGSCKKDILDITPLDRLGENAVWTDEAFIKAYQAELYNAIPTNFGPQMYSKFTDEAINTTAGTGPELFRMNIMNPDNIAGVNNAHNNYMGYWNRGYQYIRKINVFLDRMSAADALKFDAKTRLVAEAKFLSAFIYLNLIQRYGGVPIVTQLYELGDKEVFKRNTFDECVAHIEKLLNEATTDLPTTYASSSSEYGRATKDAAHALRSRLWLYAASPLFNPTNDKAKWQKAADAAAVFVNNGDKGYELFPDYKTLFNRSSGAAQKEFILARNYTPASGHQFPITNITRRYNGWGGWWASSGPSQNFVDDYDMINGEPAFTWSGNSKSVNPASGYNPNRPYFNRDPRFEASVLHDSSIFVAGISASSIKADTIQTWVEANGGTKAGFDSWKISSDNTRGGYILRKFMPEGVVYAWANTYDIPWPFFRLAEIYLNYAEAKFELGDEATARQYINKVRARQSVNMPPIPKHC